MLAPPPGAAVADGYWFEQGEENHSFLSAGAADLAFDTSCGELPCIASSVSAAVPVETYREVLQRQRHSVVLPTGAVDVTHLLSHVWSPTPLCSSIFETGLEELQKESIKLGETGLGASGQALLRRVLFSALRK
jgi:hypothetical protein